MMRTMASNLIRVLPGQSASLIRYCRDCNDGSCDESALTVFVTCFLIPGPPSNELWRRDVKLKVRFQGERGGGTFDLDSAQGCVFTVGGSTIDIQAINNSTDETEFTGANQFNTYQLEASIVSGAMGHDAPRFSERVVIQTNEPYTPFVRVPPYARELQVYTNVLPSLIPIAEFGQSDTLIGFIPLYVGATYASTGMFTAKLPVISGCEYVRVSNPTMLDRRYVFVWTLDL